ncbi:MAG: mechanosensitive ion channel family protein, partial [Allorhizobium sp.]
MDFQIFLTSAENWLTALFFNEWGGYQIAIMVVGYVVAILAARRVEPVMEARARRIKGNPDLLRVIIAFMRRLKWLFMIFWLWFARIVLLHFTWPSHSWLISMALTLVTVWFVVSVLTRVIRNRSVALFVALVIWSYSALYLLGFENSVSAGLDSVALTMGTVRLSLLSVTKGIAITAALIWIAVFCGNVITNRVQRVEDISPAYKVLLSKFIKIGLIIIACAFALSATGIDLTAFTVFSGAIGVGIGFGLQKVVSNFISGIIIL